jgi:hypothetical protein
MYFPLLNFFILNISRLYFHRATLSSPSTIEATGACLWSEAEGAGVRLTDWFAGWVHSDFGFSINGISDIQF